MAARWLVLLLLAPVLVAACADDDASSAGPDGDALRGSVTVFGAASLTGVFGEMAVAFERTHPGVSVEPVFAGSSDLARQIQDGAPADVFASADATDMDLVVESGDVTADPVPFAGNVLEIAVPAGNPGEVGGLEDFARDDLLIGLCAEEVPCGRFGRQVLDDAGVAPALDTDEPDVRSLLTKVAAGELDAGMVYRSDVLAEAGDVEGITIADDLNVTVTYPIAPISASDVPEVADAFIAFVLSGDGQRIMEDAGFLPAP